MKVIYKCKNCGEKVVFAAMESQVMNAFSKSIDKKIYDVEDMPKIIAHNCKDGTVGIAKVVGFDFK